MSRKALDRLADAAIVAICVDGSDWPRSLVSAALIPDGWMALVERRDGRRRLVPAGEDPQPDSGDRLLLVRNRAITVPLSVEDTPGSDGHPVSGTCEVLLRWQMRDDDLGALGRSLLDQGELSLDGLAAAVADAGGQTALQQFIRQRPASSMTRDDLRDELLETLREQLKRFVFSTGLTLERVAALKLSSPSLAEQEALQRETAASVERIKAREMVEQAAAAAAKRRLDDLGELLEKLKAGAAADSGVQWHDLLPALSTPERGRLLENLWRVTPNRTTAAAIVAVAGYECAWLDPADPEQIARRIRLDEDLGGLRSVTFSPQVRALLIGAACGVWVIGADDGQVQGRYEVPGAGRPRTGFNAATMANDRLCATHSQLGAWCWPLSSPDLAEALLAPVEGVPKTIRAATTSEDGRLLFAADDSVYVRPAADAEPEILPPTPDVVLSLAVHGRTVYAGTTNGTLLQQDLDRPEGWVVVHRGGEPIESIFPRRWGDLVELVVPTGASGISGVYARERIVARLMESRTPLRRAWASDDLLVGLSDYRDRLVVLKADASTRIGRDVPVGRMLGHLIQDACIVLSDQAAEPQSDEGANA